MYIPTSFAERDLTKLHDFIERHSFGLLVTQGEGVPFASHLPFLLERTVGPHGTLVGHLARSSPQWREACSQTAPKTFSITPNWRECWIAWRSKRALSGSCPLPMPHSMSCFPTLI